MMSIHDYILTLCNAECRFLFNSRTRKVDGQSRHKITIYGNGLPFLYPYMANSWRHKPPAIHARILIDIIRFFFAFLPINANFFRSLDFFQNWHWKNRKIWACPANELLVIDRNIQSTTYVCKHKKHRTVSDHQQYSGHFVSCFQFCKWHKFDCKWHNYGSGNGFWYIMAKN